MRPMRRHALILIAAMIAGAVDDARASSLCMAPESDRATARSTPSEKSADAVASGVTGCGERILARSRRHEGALSYARPGSDDPFRRLTGSTTRPQHVVDADGHLRLGGSVRADYTVTAHGSDAALGAADGRLSLSGVDDRLTLATDVAADGSGGMAPSAERYQIGVVPLRSGATTVLARLGVTDDADDANGTRTSALDLSATTGTAYGDVRVFGRRSGDLDGGAGEPATIGTSVDLDVASVRPQSGRPAAAMPSRLALAAVARRPDLSAATGAADAAPIAGGRATLTWGDDRRFATAAVAVNLSDDATTVGIAGTKNYSFSVRSGVTAGGARVTTRVRARRRTHAGAGEETGVRADLNLRWRMVRLGTRVTAIDGGPTPGAFGEIRAQIDVLALLGGVVEHRAYMNASASARTGDDAAGRAGEPGISAMLVGGVRF